MPEITIERLKKELTPEAVVELLSLVKIWIRSNSGMLESDYEIVSKCINTASTCLQKYLPNNPTENVKA